LRPLDAVIYVLAWMEAGPQCTFRNSLSADETMG